MTPICSQSEVASTVYLRVTGKHTWYVPLHDHAAEGIHRCTCGLNGDGYNGKLMLFRLTSGEVDVVRGPWRERNADGLYADTGVDLRGTYWTRITISGPEGQIWYQERNLQPGTFERHREVLKAFWSMNTNIERAYCRVDSRITSRGGWVTRDGGDVRLLESYVSYLGGVR